MDEKKKKKRGCLIPIIVVIALIAIVGSIGGNNNEDSGNNVTINEPTTAVQSTEHSDGTEDQPQEEQLEKYGDGMYKVGSDLPAGEYILDPSSSGYFQIASDSTGELDSIVSNDNFTGTRYITVSEGQYVTLTRCTAYPVKYISEGKVKNDNLSNGMYKVGVDIEAGEYKITPNGSGYCEVNSSSNGSLDSIISNQNFSGDIYISVSDGQYLKLSRATLIK